MSGWLQLAQRRRIGDSFLLLQMLLASQQNKKGVEAVFKKLAKESQ